MNVDGISYLDMGDAYLRGGWRMLVNGHWSPPLPLASRRGEGPGQTLGILGIRGTTPGEFCRLYLRCI